MGGRLNAFADIIPERVVSLANQPVDFDLLPIIVPWLQLNSLGLTILLHPNTDDPRADHLYYTLWVNRSQPVNAYNMPKQASVEKIFPNTKPTVKLET